MSLVDPPDSGTLYHSIFQHMLEGMALHEIICDDQGQPVDYRFLEVNPAFEQVTGVKAADLVGRTARQVFPNLEPFWVEIYGRVALGGEPARFEQYEPELQKYFQVTAFSPQPGQFVALFIDVSERSRAFAALRESDLRGRTLFEDNPIAMFRSLMDGTVLDVNRAFALLFGYESPDHFKAEVQLASQIFADPARRPALINVLQSGQTILNAENRYRRRDGSEFFGHLLLRVVSDSAGQIIFLEGFIEDVTAQKQLAEDLRISDQKIAAAFRQSPDLMTISELESGRIVEANQGFEPLTGYSPAEVVGRTFLELNLWADPAQREVMVELTRRDGRLQNWEFDLRHRSGEIRICSTSVEIFTLAGVRYLIATTQDITERKRMEAALRRSEERYRRIVANANEGVLMVDAQNNITFANQRIEEMLGQPVEEIQGQPVETFLFLDDLPAQSQQYISRRRGETATYERRFLRRDGSQGWASISASPVFDEHGVYQGSFGVVVDITARKQAEDGLAVTLHRLKALYEVTQELAALTADYRSVLTRAVHLTARLFSDTCVLSLVASNQQQLDPVACHDEDPEVEYFVKVLLGSASYPIGSGVAGRVVQTGEAVRLNNLPAEQLRAMIQPDYLPYLERYTIHGLLIVPLKARGQVIGTLGVVRNRPRLPYTGEDQLFLQDLASRIALALAVAKKKK